MYRNQYECPIHVPIQIHHTYTMYGKCPQLRDSDEPLKNQIQKLIQIKHISHFQFMISVSWKIIYGILKLIGG